eukprot:gene3949-2808_t
METVTWRSWLKLDPTRAFVYYFSSAGTLGILPIVCFYYPHVYYQIIAVACSPEDSQFVHVSYNGEELVCEIEHYKQAAGEHVFTIEVETSRYSASNRNKYTFHRVPDVPIQFKRFLALDYPSRHQPDELDEEARILKHHYGQNVMKIPETTFMEILLRYLLSPFYLFQYFSVSVWIAEDYWTFALVILFITLIAIYVTAQESLSNLESLRALAGVHGDVQRIKRAEIELGNAVELVDDSILIPGERIMITDHMDIPCDAILLTGKVVVDESMLTGESVPVGKVPIDLVGLAGDENFVLSQGTIMEDHVRVQADTEVSISQRQQDEQQRRGKKGSSATDSLVHDHEIATKRAGSVLFAGTKVKATFGDECIAVVYRTGYRSAKGSLISSLLKPKNDFITFVSDAMWVLLAMVIFCTLLYVLSGYILYVKDGASITEVVFWYFDALTCAVPSALIASLSIATTVSIARLKSTNIFVSDTSRVNYAGVINAVCFDKTGTLTDEALSFQGALLSSTVTNPATTAKEATRPAVTTLEEHRSEDGPLPLLCQEIMATCHGLLLYGFHEGAQASAVGDPLEMELLRASGWRLQPSTTVMGRMVAFPPSATSSALPATVSESTGYAILKHFEFSPDRLRAASLVQDPRTNRVRFFVKGSPETVIQLCRPETVPARIHDELLALARKGLRVLALAARDFSADDESVEAILSRTQGSCEDRDVVFVGLVYLSNQLKDSARRTIAVLHDAKIHTVMITGDHIFTAIAVAEECGILSPVTPAESMHTRSTATAAASAAAAAHGGGAPIATKPSAPPSANPRLFIVDHDPAVGRVVVIDAITERVVDGVSLSQLVYLAAKTSLQEIKLDAAVAVAGASNSFAGLSFASLSSSLSASASAPLVANESRVSPMVQLAVTGRGLTAVRRAMPALFPSLIRYAKVFARTKPMEKKLIVETLMASPEFDDLGRLTTASTTTVSSASDKSYAPSSTSRDTHDETASLLRDTASASSSAAGTAAASSTAPPRRLHSAQLTAQLSGEDLEILTTPMDVAFCGDGANDMIALRTATVGVSLCDAQTSVAAPITSQRPTPFAVVEVIREGRCSLITAYVLILFNIMYATIQLYFVNTGYFFGMQASAWSYLVQDLFFGLVLGIVTSYTEPTSRLSSTMPPKRFLKMYPLFRLLANLLLFIGFQNVALYVTTRQSFYSYSEADDPFGDSYGYPTAIGQHMALGQIMIASVVCSIGHPYRKAWYTNRYHVGALVVQCGWLLFQIFASDDWFLQHVLDIEPVPVYYGFVLLALLVLNALVCAGVTELGDRWLLQRTNRRWFDLVQLTDIVEPPSSLSSSSVFESRGK